MSGFFAIVQHDGEPVSNAVASRMLDAMSERGADRSECWRDGAVTMGVQRNDWEFTSDFAGPVLVVQDADAVVVADARLYYRDELRRKLSTAGVRSKGQTPSQLLLAAYQAFGERLAEELEGDFAFAVWDRRRRRLVASRDSTGSRPVFWASIDGGVAVASSINSLRAYPGCSNDLDHKMIAVDAAGLLFSGGDGTAFRAIRQVRAGTTLTLDHSNTPRCTNWFSLESTEGRAPRSRDEAASQLRDLLGRAVRERCSNDGPTASWMSGGFDSPAIVAVGGIAAGSDAPADLRVVSMSFPEGDSAREDEMISTIAAHLGHRVNWVDGSAVPSIAISAVDHRGEPFMHLYGDVLAALARESRTVDARIALNGHGGDFIFQCGPWFLSDMLRRGQWWALSRQWNALDVDQERARTFWKYAVEPTIPAAIRSILERLRGRPLIAPFERTVPKWMETTTTRELGLFDLARSSGPDFANEGACAAELRWYLTNPGFSRLHATMSANSLAEGVEGRAPFLDQRVVRFLAAGNRAERFDGGETKRLLRDAMQPLLPASALMRRPHKTGTLASRLRSSVRQAIPMLRTLFYEPILAELGLIEPELLRKAIDATERGSAPLLVAEQLFRSAVTESWLRQFMLDKPTRAGLLETVVPVSRVAAASVNI